MPEDLKKMDNTMNQPELESFDYKPFGQSTGTIGLNSHVIKPETRVNEVECPVKSPNIEIIEEIEHKISEVNDKLNSLPHSLLRTTAFEEMDLFERTTLFQLRKAFE